ncbi:S locus-related glycoprotein 1 binding pollen coat [Cucumis melo var. makuwa]|uniref:S locus-related glycoprotein 1 binding pollen coat n=1 Tax=Cucumis melo var. makuwa TaxID=1194695 RepID=A0A5D3D8G5_CUCMM|nr:S locus-related glycoprotein 1 binding pollen coat [Cucumis melo var. makuwa]
MKSVSFSAILLALLLIFSEETMMKSVEGVGGLCEKALHGGGCKDVECISGCKALFGKVAQGTGRSAWKISLGWEAAQLRSARVGSDLLAFSLWLGSVCGSARLTTWLSARLVKLA